MRVKSSEILGDGDSRDLVTERGHYVHTARYLREQFITETSLNEQGFYIDEYNDRAQYIRMVSGTKEVVCRLISADKRGILSLPTAAHFSVDSEAILRTSGAVRLSDITPKDVVEVSALAANPEEVEESQQYNGLDASTLLYTAALRRSLDAGHKLWMMNIDERYKRGLENLLGADNVVTLGAPQDYMGPETIPVCLSPVQVVESVLRHPTKLGSHVDIKKYLQQTMQGVSEAHLSKDMVTLLKESGIETKKTSAAEKLLHNKLAILYGGMIIYSALRVIPLSFVPNYDGGVAQYIIIDVGTAGTQALGMEKYFKGRTRLQRAFGATATIASFIAPYGYVASMNSQGSALDYPPAVYAVAGGFAGLSVYLEVSKSMKDARIKRALEKPNEKH